MTQLADRDTEITITIRVRPPKPPKPPKPPPVVTLITVLETPSGEVLGTDSYVIGL